MGKNELKYKNEIENYSNCPPSNCIEENKQAYRFIKEIISEKSFLPEIIQTPKRKFKSPISYCQAHGLSMFKDEVSAKNTHMQMCKDRPFLIKSLGNKLAKGLLTHEDGLCSPSNTTGHFTFHEYQNKDIKTVFSIIGDL